MRAGFLVILSIVLALTGYVCWHLWRIAPSGWKLVVTGLFVLWMATMFAGFAYTERVPVKVATVLYEVGNTWMIAFLYLLLVFLVADIASLCLLLPKTLLKDSAAGLLGAVGIVALVMTLGAIHYPHKYREELTLETDKPLEKPLTIVLAEKPDLVLIGGDIIDRSLRPVTEGRYEEEFRRLEAPVWTVLGNHETYAGLPQAEQFFEAAGIRVLKDSVAHFKGVDVIGRKDRSTPGRAALRDLADGLEGFTLVLDHQPSHLEEAEAAGVDFQFSGHTHRGQVWPVSWATDLMFEKSWGAYRKGNTRYYISSGLGLWGAKIRVGTRSEYLVLKLKGKND